MKIARFFGVVFGILGVILMCGTAVLCIAARDIPTQVAQVPEAGLECAQEVMDAIASGNLAAASARMYGQPDLGVAEAPADPESQRLWQAFLDSLSYEFLGPCYATETGFARKALVSALDVTSITGKVGGHAKDLLNARIASAVEMGELYDETGEFRADLVDEVMAQALDMAMEADAEIKAVDVTLALIHRDGAWWAIPDDALLKLLAGGV